MDNHNHHFENGADESQIQQWSSEMEPSAFLHEAIERLRFRNSWTKDELCHNLDVKPSELHKYLKGEEVPPESLLLIVKEELEAGGSERRRKVRVMELLDRVIDLEKRLEDVEQRLDQHESGHP